MKSLDFIIIGAQKGGTTSLFKYLGGHPRIYLPPEKEVPFFTQDRLFEAGWPSFAQKYYKGADDGQVWGKATPSYLHDLRVAGRIAETMPEARLIVLLRHPIERAKSHYKMNVRRGRERRTFSEAMDDLLDPDALEQARSLNWSVRHEADLYVAWGEYARQLRIFYRHLDRSQILALFTDELATMPQSVLDRTLRFLRLPSGYTPSDLGHFYHRGSTGRKLAWIDSTWCHRLQQRIPGRMGERIRFWLEIWNIDPEMDRNLEISPTLRRRLLDHYAPDVTRLEELLGVSVPWSDFQTGAQDRHRGRGELSIGQGHEP